MLSTAPQIQGFSLTSGAKNWTIQGFDITNQNEGSGVEDKSAYGIFLSGAINFKILNNYVHELCSSGIESLDHDTTGTGIIANNHVWRAEMEGIGLAGVGETADHNTVWETVQWPGRLGSTPPGANPKGVANKDMSGCLTRSGSDGDYFRFFSRYGVFTRNLGFGIPYQGLSSMSRGPCPADPSPAGSTTSANTSCYDSEPHIDGFQTFGTSAQAEDYNFIMKNVILGTYTGSPANCYTSVMGDIESTNNVGNVNTINYIGNVGVCGYSGILDNGSPDQADRTDSHHRQHDRSRPQLDPGRDRCLAARRRHQRHLPEQHLLRRGRRRRRSYRTGHQRDVPRAHRPQHLLYAERWLAGLLLRLSDLSDDDEHRPGLPELRRQHHEPGRRLSPRLLVGRARTGQFSSTVRRLESGRVRESEL